MSELSLSQWWIIVATFVLAGLAKGVTGMGLPTVAMGLLGTLMAPVTAAALLVVPSLVTNLWQLLAGPDLRGLLRRLWPMMLGVVAGTLAGSGLLANVAPEHSGPALGVVLIVYAVFALRAPALAVPAGAEPWLSPLVGVITGVVTGATGVFVIPAVPYLQSLRLDKEALVQALGLSFTLSTLALMAGLAARGQFHAAHLGVSTLVLLPALLGLWLGQVIRRRLGPRGFRPCFLLFLLALGLELASRPWFA